MQWCVSRKTLAAHGAQVHEASRCRCVGKSHDVRVRVAMCRDVLLRVAPSSPSSTSAPNATSKLQELSYGETSATCHVNSAYTWTRDL